MAPLEGFRRPVMNSSLPEGNKAIILPFEGNRAWFQKENPDLTKVAQLVIEAARPIFESVVDEPWDRVTKYFSATKDEKKLRGVDAIQATVSSNIATIAQELSLSTEDPRFGYLSAATYYHEAKLGNDFRMQEYKSSMEDVLDQYKADNGLSDIAPILDVLLYVDLPYAERKVMLTLVSNSKTKKELIELQRLFTEKYGPLDKLYEKKVAGIAEEVVDSAPLQLIMEEEPAIKRSSPTITVVWDPQKGAYIKTYSGGAEVPPKKIDDDPEKTAKEAEKQRLYKQLQREFNRQDLDTPQENTTLDRNWTTRAACKVLPTDNLFTQGAAQNNSKQICMSCKVRTECLAEALDAKIEFGVYGGMTERERRATLKRRPDVDNWWNLLETAKAEYERNK